MTAKYSIISLDLDGNISIVRDNERCVFIPADEGNRDWREFLAWVDEGNEPDPME